MCLHFTAEKSRPQYLLRSLPLELALLITAEICFDRNIVNSTAISSRFESVEIALFNLNSLVNKVGSLSYFISSYSTRLGLICICESWLTPSVSSSSVNIQGFSLFRHDSPSGVAKHGVAVYVRDDIRVDRVSQLP